MKSRTMSVLRELNDDGCPKYPEAIKCTTEAHLIGNEKQLTDIVEKITYPIMVKLECGVGAVSARVANNEVELRDWYYKITDNFHDEHDFPDMGLSHSNSVMLMEYHGGSEHDIDIVIYDGELIGAFISDSCTNGTTNSFIETCGVMPTLLSQERQEQLIKTTHHCCRALGLNNGVYNVEMKQVAEGPRLIEVNGRMGGSYRQHWIDRLYGINTPLLSAMIACGIRPPAFNVTPDRTAVGVMIAKHVNDVSVQDWKLLEDLDAADDVIFFHRPDKPIFVNVVRPHANVAALGKTFSDAKEKLLTLCQQFNISHDNHIVKNFIDDMEEEIHEINHSHGSA